MYSALIYIFIHEYPLHDHKFYGQDLEKWRFMLNPYAYLVLIRNSNPQLRVFFVKKLRVCFYPLEAGTQTRFVTAACLYVVCRTWTVGGWTVQRGDDVLDLFQVIFHVDSTMVIKEPWKATNLGEYVFIFLPTTKQIKSKMFDLGLVRMEDLGSNHVGLVVQSLGTRKPPVTW